MSIRELYKYFNENLTPEDDNDEDNNNIMNEDIKEDNNTNLLDEIKYNIFEDINDDYINPNDCMTNRFNCINSLKLPKISENSEDKKTNKLSFDFIKDIPKSSRGKTNREENYFNRKQEEDCNEIIKDFLYISSYKTASTITDLKSLKITNIINCSGDLCENLSPDSSLLDIEYLTLNIKDNVSENIECLFFKCINYINEIKSKKGRVLIHCYKGVSRSVSIVIAYLIYLYKWNYDEAFDFVQSKRSMANPNIGFYLQLKTFHQRLNLDSDRLEIFSVSHFNPEQKDLIVCRLIYNNISLKDKSSDKKYLDDIESDDDDDYIEENEESEDNKKEEKKEVVLNEKGMFIFAMKQKIFIAEGKKISEKNYELYKKSAFDYIKEIQKFEKLGFETKEDNIQIIKQSELEEKYEELINDKNIIIQFSESNDMDKFYIN